MDYATTMATPASAEELDVTVERLADTMTLLDTIDLSKYPKSLILYSVLHKPK